MNDLVCESQEKSTEVAASAESFVIPPMTMFENGESFSLLLDMPGVAKRNLEVSIENNEMTVVGRRSAPVLPGTVVHREVRQADFRRAFEIDSAIDAAKITVALEQGVATISLPKAEQAKPRKITVA